MWLIYVLFLFSANALHVKQSSKIVKINQGLVRGYQNGNLVAFYGIPYATTPISSNRFKAPLPAPRWSDIFNATRKNIVCPQRIRHNENLTYQEDCLNLNVFVPYSKVMNKNFLPVLVYIHGGAFIHSGDRGGCENLVKHGVIVVTFEYRVGILGFLCLGVEGAAGNAGIKDQVAALRWVKENIARFGGDPDNITVYGTSAGAAAVDTLILSGRANHLFKRAILESGSAFTGEYDRNSTQRALNIAIKMGFRNTNKIQDLLMFFKTLPASVLGLAPMDDFSVDSRVGPCIETIHTNMSIITEHPIKIIRNNQFNKIPCMSGYGNLEGIIHAKNFLNIRNDIYHNFSKVIPPIPSNKNLKSIKKLQEKIKKAYFGKQEIKIDNSFVKFSTDAFIAYPSLVSAVNYARRSKSPVYLFEFAYDGGLGLPRESFRHLMGARHSDFWAYIFTHGVVSNNTQDQITSERLTTLVTNFVKFGDPTPTKTKLLPIKWTPVGKKSTNYLSIGKTVELRNNVLDERLELLDKLQGCQLCSSSSVLMSKIKLWLLGLFAIMFL